MDEQIEARIEQLKQERDEFVTQANARIAAINGGIAELERLIASDKKDDEVDVV